MIATCTNCLFCIGKTFTTCNDPESFKYKTDVSKADTCKNWTPHQLEKGIRL